jgi:serine/threonine protein kinase
LVDVGGGVMCEVDEAEAAEFEGVQTGSAQGVVFHPPADAGECLSPLPSPGAPPPPEQFETLLLPFISSPMRSSLEESINYPIEVGGVVAGRYRIVDYLGQGVFSRAVQCIDLESGLLVCLKITRNNKVRSLECHGDFDHQAAVFLPFRTPSSSSPRTPSLAGPSSLFPPQQHEQYVLSLPPPPATTNKNKYEASPPPPNQDFFDMGLMEVKVLRLLNEHDPTDEMHVLRLLSFFYHKEHLFFVCELLRDNLYELYKYVSCSPPMQPYFTLPRVRSIAHQCLVSLAFIHSFGLVHCDLKPENIVIQSFSRCRVKVIDFGSSTFPKDPHSSYVQARRVLCWAGGSCTLREG